MKFEKSNLSSNNLIVLTFKKGAGNFLAAILSQPLNNSPLKYAFVRNATSLNPLNMANKAKRSFCINHFSIFLQILVKVNKISRRSAERAEAQYRLLFFDVLESNIHRFQQGKRSTLLVEIKAMLVYGKFLKLYSPFLMDNFCRTWGYSK